MPFGPASLLGVERFSEESEAPLELLPGDDDAKKEQIIRAVYKQVLGNAYVMESERQLVPESQFKLGEISVREFVRRIAKSDLYRSRLFETCARYRYIELAFRHLMGRAPIDFQEMRDHSERLDAKGYDADIDSFLDCDDYQNAFGEWIVPYQRGWKTESCTTLQEFTWSFQLLRGNSSSSLKGDLAGISSKLGGAAYQNRPLAVVPPSSSETSGWSFRPSRNLQDAPTRLGVGAGEEGMTYRVEVTGYSANNVRRISRYVRSNRVYYVPFNKLSEQFIRIHREGGKIASITPVT
ncbi:MAG: phycobilisome linker polypeptide [Parasynechococcus sp.]|jgi:phycoerythrin-associated linker protein|uniref:Phycobilisome rod linker polypeptide (Lr), C-phycoerythrin class I-associated protein n=1 Tax=uncultured Synechococcus sp. TaxID=154535 RepID=A0A024CHZ7_9SYNE|nr:MULTISPECIES: phycobilisome linker polypeptide [unclassified Synechococcus]AHZ34062.1 phycobilisome rod linker polypeptide (Lr), C-phycoerythrin class I-associated protein [uncultured Synechococcus sp.]MDG1061045.1 phycobilisome linker polypeptide [Synechococcus sp. cluster3_bin.96]MDG2192487.1 phycobilisome linker polypeptide [Synechococcus sp. cluster2_bin.209]RCL58074.1 MAG: photosystem I reaction center subunit XII [Synechococcus sp. MED-G69]ABB26840.1 phycobilisome linker polypeptide [|tara:strand:+ start:1653 stop:2537 length:885 start_codon:yes stop_codon:yes gene_type:complete